MQRTSIICLLILQICLAGQSQAQENITITDVFSRGDDGYACYRIPAIVKARNGDLLAFAEARKHNCSDTGDIDLVVKSSADNGKTWSDIRIVYDAGNEVCGNPAPVVDTKTGEIYLVACYNLGQDKERQIIDGTSREGRKVLFFRSTDHGRTWSNPRDITDMVKRTNWTWYATGPCHAIQLQEKTNKGRIVVPANHMVAGSREFHAHLIYSDDRGETWHIGGITHGHGGNESTVAELKDGTLMHNFRNYNRKAADTRGYAVSRDGGETLSETQYARELIEPICQGSLINGQRRGKNTDTLLFSNPAATDKRKMLTVRASCDGGKTWGAGRTVYAGPSAYSDLVIMDGRHVGVLFEYGEIEYSEKIGFAVMDIQSLKAN